MRDGIGAVFSGRDFYTLPFEFSPYTTVTFTTVTEISMFQTPCRFLTSFSQKVYTILLFKSSFGNRSLLTNTRNFVFNYRVQTPPGSIATCHTISTHMYRKHANSIDHFRICASFLGLLFCLDEGHLTFLETK